MLIDSHIVGIAAIILACLIPFGLGIYSILKEPVWVRENNFLSTYWKPINISAIGFSMICGFMTWNLYKDFEVFINGIALLNVSLLSFCAFQMIFTDFSSRFADRRILRISTIISFLFGIYFSLNTFGTNSIIIYVILFLIATIVVFIPGIGSSDGRALQLAIATSFPLVGLLGLQWGISVFLVLIVAFGIGNAIFKKDIKIILQKISMPLVPIILFSFLISIFACSLIL